MNHHLAKRLRSSTLLLLLLMAACAAPANAPQAPTASPTEAIETASYPMTIADDYGDVTIPAHPERIITIGEELNETLLSLGVKPIGFASSRVERGGAKQLGVPIDSDYLDADFAGSPIFVGGDSPNLESVVALQPDLILYPRYGDDEVTYKSLTQIAPTLGLYPQGRGAWQSIIGKLGEVLGLEAKAGEVVADFDARVAELRHALAPIVAAHPNLTLLYLPGADMTMVFSEAFSFGGMVDDLGFHVVAPEGVTVGESGAEPIAIEALARLESDAILTIQFAEGVQEGFPVEPILASLDIPVLRTVIEPRRPATGPITERYYLENFASLLLAEFGDDTAATTPVAESEGETRLFAHALGETEIPTNPQRIVVLDGVDDLLALGIQPVGAAQWVGSASGMEATWPSYLDPAELEGIVFLGSSSQPNLEALVALDPDLIIGRVNPHEELYAQLSEIAPTVIVDVSNSGQWREQFFQYAEVVGREAEAQELMAAFEERAAMIAGRLAQLDPNPEVSVARFDPERIVTYQGGLFVGQVLAAAGVKRPANQAIDNSSEQLSLETITELDADVIFAIESNPEQSRYQELVDTPLWGQLRAVQNERVYAVPFDLWIGGWTITGANRILDDVERYLLPE